MAWKTNAGSDKNSSSNKYYIQETTPGWRPCYLRRRVLLVFAIVFCIIIAALETLNQISQAHNGIASSIKSRHYFWTYGPTAILTIVASFWSRVEFQAKQSAPWYSMLHGPEQAEKSVLLDYISEMQLISLWRALKNRHFIVASGVASSILLRLLVIFSTGLFSLQQVQVQRTNVPIQIHSNFNVENSTLYGFGLQAYDILNGVLFDNLPFPEGSTANFAFQEFSASALPSDANITVPIQGLMADLDCEVADMTVKGWPPGKYSSDLLCLVDLTTPSCNISNVRLQMMSDDVPLGAALQEGQCDNTNGPGGTRVVATSQEAKIVQSKAGDDSKKTLRRSVALICKPELMFMGLKAQAKVSELSSNAHFEPLGSQSTTLPGLTAGNLVRPALRGFENTNGFRAIESHRTVVGDFSAQTQVALGMWLTGATPELEPLFEVDVLQNVTVSYYRAMTAQLLHLARSQQEATVYGQAIVHENRVLVSQLPLRLMEALLSLGVLLLGCMIFFVSPETLAQWNPNYISSIVAILANSEDLRQSLRGTGAASMQDIYSRLAGRHYYSQSTPRGTAILGMGENSHELDLNPPSEYVAWKPFPGLASRASGFVIIAMIIAALEIVLHLSQAENGIADISFNEYVHYLWTIIPASIMVMINIFYSSMDFNTRCLAPYAHLKQSTGATLKHSLELSFLDNLGLHNIFLAVDSRHFAVLATTLATGAAFFLTIVTSGLYSATDVPRQFGSNFTQNGSFPSPKAIAPAALNIDEFSEVTGIVTAKYILQDNLTFPSWTWDDLVLPKILPPSLLGLGSLESSYVDIQVSALRAAPSCQLQTSADLNPNITMENNSTDTFRLTVNLPRLSCSDNIPVGNWTQEVFSGKQLQSKHFGYSMHSPCSNPDPMTPGPKLWTNSYIWGQLSNISVKSILALRCMQYAETIDASIRLKLPGLELASDHPPVPDESSAKLVPGVYVPMSEWWVLSDRDSYPLMDAFFHFLIAGKYGIPIEDLGVADQSEKVIEAIKRQIRLITAQQFNYFSRGTSNETASQARLVGNITMPNRLRLVQDATSTRILQGILAVMLVLGILGSVIMNTDHVLPKNPCSIAAVGSLLADSNLIDRHALEMMHPNDKPLQSSFFSQCCAYLGWRDTKYNYESLGVGKTMGSRGKFMIYLDSDDESRGWDISQSETDVRDI
ncbi:Protein of unknown function DUF3433 [Penicillium cf. griseofulvum]|uniref:Uncharacterized protein n=1 Tax=Penicillium cf. griseofulvum TaxID=2972120 RepID=A0A9W9MED5_9EURO|nr:Protein of unknown function DUF3433 [Penicillium cf. griseofulvum]KAJ5423932.1 Protein of unknown function DUF3433 [Penicillium cf. griseofulvum]